MPTVWGSLTDEAAMNPKRTRILAAVAAFLGALNMHGQPPPEGLAGTTGNYLGGVATLNGKVILILDVAEVLGHTGEPGAPPDKPET